MRRLARAYVARTAGLEAGSAGVVVARWGARLSAILIRGNGATVRAGGVPLAPAPHYDVEGAPGLACSVPDGDSAYELLVR